MNKEQQKVLEGFSDSTIFHFLREVRNKAFISWSTDDIIGTAKEYGFVMDENTAIDIVAEMDKQADCEHGITWETVRYYVDKWIRENSFEVDIKTVNDDHEYTTLFCSLETNENIEEFWNDDSYYFYGLSKEEVNSFVGKEKMVTDCIILKVR